MNHFDYQPRTRIVYGADRIDSLGDLAGELGTRRALVVSDPGIIAAGHTGRGIDALEAAGIETHLFDGVVENPSTDQVEQGLMVAQRHDPELIVGLGGGSADAAATLLALDRLWGLELPQGRLLGLASDLGSDVPFLLVGGTAFTWGRGEEFEVLPDLPRRWLVLLCSGPSAPEKTAGMYARLGREHFSDGKKVEILVNGIKGHRDILEDWMMNSFDAVAHRAFPNMKALRGAFSKAGARQIVLSGAGPTLYALEADEAAGAALTDRLKAQGLDSRLAHTVPGV